VKVATFPDIAPDLKAAMPELRGRLLANEQLGPLTWFRVGGPAQILFTPADEDDLAYFLSRLPSELPVYVVGVGSNLIVRDGGMPGVVIRLSPRGFGETVADGDIVRAGTAALDKRVAEAAAAAKLGGLEFYFGIPGTIGGALRMNAGAYGHELVDVVTAAEAVTYGCPTRDKVPSSDGKFECLITGRSILRLVDPPGRIVGGDVVFDGMDLATLDDGAMRAVRHYRCARNHPRPNG